MLKVATAISHEPYREYKDVERVYSGSTEIDKILDKNGNVLFAVNKEVEGTPALTFKGKEEANLKNYRIYGQTIDGESVGDRTGNLFDGEIMIGGLSDSTGNEVDEMLTRVRTSWIMVEPSETYSFNLNNLDYKIRNIYVYDESKSFIYATVISSNSATVTVSSLASYVRFVFRKNNELETVSISDCQDKFMFNSGSTPLPYEPYGYKVPVTVEGKNLCNNIWEQKAINVETGNPTPNAKSVCCDFIPVKPNVTYSCSRTISNNYNNLRCYGANKNYLGSGGVLANKANPLPQGASFGTFMITDARVSYIRFNDLSNSLDTKYMLVEGIYTAETMPPYEPYHVPVTTNLYLPEPLKMVGDEAEYIDYREQKQHRVRKNLLKNTATSRTSNGLTFTVNTDGSVTCNGRREQASTFFTIGSVTTSGKIILSGCPSGGSSASFAMRAFSATVSNPGVYYDIGDSCMLNTPDTYNIDIRIQSNYACDNLTFYPMIRKADIEDDTYEPYIENTEVDVTLPALPVLPGTNTLSVGTEVQPSNVYLKGRIREVS